MFNKSPDDSKGQYLIIDKRFILYLLLFIGIYIVLSLYRAALSSILLGLLFAYLLHPLVLFLNKKLKLKHNIAAVIVFILSLAILITTVRYSTPVVLKQINILTNDIDRLTNELIGLQPVIEDILNIQISFEDIIPELKNELDRFLDPNLLFRNILSATRNFVWVLITIMTCLYTLLDSSKLLNWIYSIIPENLSEPLKSIQEEVDLVWRTYLRGQISLMVIIGVLSGIFGVSLGLRNALAIGLIAGLLEIIPSLGPTITTLIAAISAWTQGSKFLDVSNIWFTVIVCGVFILIQFFENTVLVPRIMGRRMKLHPALVFIAIVSTLSLYGILAGLLVVPVLGSILVIGKYVFQGINPKKINKN